MKIEARVRHMGAWRRAFFAFLAGMLSALAMDPFGYYWVLFFTFPFLVSVLRTAQTGRAAFVLGWCFAFGFHLCGIYWITLSLFYDIRRYWWGVPFAMAGLPAFLSLYYGCVSVAAWRIGLQKTSGALVLALMWFIAEYAKGHLLTGFPWNLMGYAWAHELGILQLCAVLGIYGLTLITLVAATILPALIDDTRRARWVVLFCLIFFIGVFWWGENRAAQPLGVVPNVYMRIVQPNITIKSKHDLDKNEENFALLKKLSGQQASRPITHVIWPESASPYFITTDVLHRAEAMAAMPRQATLITGVLRAETAEDFSATRYYNSLIAVDRNLTVTAQYDKVHLVPYGEYTPFREYLPVKALAAMGNGFSHGDTRRNVHVDGLPSFSPLICYEAIFTGEVADRGDRPGFLLNISNDGWYGRSSGPYQHFMNVRVRAIEEGLPVVRASNSGVSAMIDSYGRLSEFLSLEQVGIIDTELPTALPPTLFVRYGEWVVWGLFVLLVVCVVALKHSEKKAVRGACSCSK